MGLWGQGFLPEPGGGGRGRAAQGGQQPGMTAAYRPHQGAHASPPAASCTLSASIPVPDTQTSSLGVFRSLHPHPQCPEGQCERGEGRGSGEAPAAGSGPELRNEDVLPCSPLFREPSPCRRSGPRPRGSSSPQQRHGGGDTPPPLRDHAVEPSP